MVRTRVDRKMLERVIEILRECEIPVDAGYVARQLGPRTKWTTAFIALSKLHVKGVVEAIQRSDGKILFKLRDGNG